MIFNPSPILTRNCPRDTMSHTNMWSHTAKCFAREAEGASAFASYRHRIIRSNARRTVSGVLKVLERQDFDFHV